MELDITKAPTLTIHTSTDRKKKMPLIGGALSSLATIYPDELRPSEPARPLHPSVRRWALTALAVTIVAMVAIVIYTLRV